MGKKENGNISDGEFWITNDEGNKVKCEVLFTFESNETHMNYIVFTDNSLDVDGSTKVYASVYDPEGKDQTLKPVESKKEWKVIETILAKIQNAVNEKNYNEPEICSLQNAQGETQEISSDISEEDISWNDIFSNFSSYGSTKAVLSYEEFIATIEEKRSVSNEKLDIQLLLEIADRLETDNNRDHIEYLFNVLSINEFTDFIRYAQMGMNAYTNDNFIVAEEAYRRAIKYCEIDSIRVGYANNLAYLIRRKEVKNPQKTSSKEIVELLKPGVASKDTLSLINMALFWAIRVGSEEDWKIADQLVSIVDKTNINRAYFWWLDVGNKDDVEGYLVHLLLIRNGKIASSPLGDIRVLFEKIKAKYKSIPEEFKNIVTSFDNGATDPFYH